MFLAGKVSLLFCCLQFFWQGNFRFFAMPPCTRSRFAVRHARQAAAAGRIFSAPPTHGAKGLSVRAALLEEENALRVHLLEKALKRATERENVLISPLILDHHIAERIAKRVDRVRRTVKKNGWKKAMKKIEKSENILGNDCW